MLYSRLLALIVLVFQVRILTAFLGVRNEISPAASFRLSLHSLILPLEEGPIWPNVY